MNRLKHILEWVGRPVADNRLFFVFMYLLGVVCIFLVNAYGKHLAAFELFADLYVLCALLMCFPAGVRRWFKFVLAVLFYVLALVDVFCSYRVGAPIGPVLVRDVMQTNVREASEALGAYVTWRTFPWQVLPVVGIMAAHVYALRHRSAAGYPRLRPWMEGGICTVLLGYGLLTSGVNKRFLWHNLVEVDTAIEMEYGHQMSYTTGFYLPVYRTMEGLKAVHIYRQEVEGLVERLGRVKVDSCSFLSKDIVLIIGESYNRHHSQLYGYGKATTPWQVREAGSGRLTPFTNVVSPYHQTSEVFKLMFSLYAYGEPGNWNEYPLFTQLFREAGYRVAFFTNQFVPDARQDIWDFSGSTFLNDTRLSKAQFDLRNDRSYPLDGQLVRVGGKVGEGMEVPRLTIFHLQGQHVDYAERYPEAFARFKGSDYRRPDLSSEDRQTLAAYDNATLYNDHVVSRIVSLYADKDAVVVYVPDHGELCFDNSRTFGRTFDVKTRNEVWQQFEIPFWIWTSDSYRKGHPEVCARLAAAKDRPFMTDNLDQLLLGLAGISCEDYRPQDDLLHPQFNAKRQRLLRGKDDYDAIMQSGKE